MFLLLLPWQTSADHQTRQKDDGRFMSRVMEWLKGKLHHSECAESTQEAKAVADKSAALAEKDRKIEEVEQAHRAQVIDDLNQRDKRVDRRIEALEQFAEQIRRRQRRKLL